MKCFSNRQTNNVISTYNTLDIIPGNLQVNSIGMYTCLNSRKTLKIKIISIFILTKGPSGTFTLSS